MISSHDFFFMLLLGTAVVRGQQVSTGDVFLTFEVHEFTALRQDARVQAALTAKESRPADQDPEGNWGLPANGFQLSLRLEKTTFNLGEPIVVDLFLRNVSDTPLPHTFVSVRGYYGFKFYRFIVTRDGYGTVERIVEDHVFSMRRGTLYPKAQWKSAVRLNGMFKMDEPGTYVITGITEAEGTGPPAEVRSANVVIRVIAAQQAKGNATTTTALIQSAQQKSAAQSPSLNSSLTAAPNSPSQASEAIDGSPQLKAGTKASPSPGTLGVAQPTPSAGHKWRARDTLFALLVLSLLGFIARLIYRNRTRHKSSQL